MNLANLRALRTVVSGANGNSAADKIWHCFAKIKEFKNNIFSEY